MIGNRGGFIPERVKRIVAIETGNPRAINSRKVNSKVFRIKVCNRSYTVITYKKIMALKDLCFSDLLSYVN